MSSEHTNKTASVLLDIDADEMQWIDLLADILNIMDEQDSDPKAE